jgi:hypothetical protein
MKISQNNKIFIVRHDCSPRSRAGDIVVQIGEPADNGTIHAHPQDAPFPVLGFARSELLDFARYLKSEPVNDYWCLQVKPMDTASGTTGFYVSNAATEIHSTIHSTHKFRFDSLGEIVYYLRERKLLSDRYYIGHYVYHPGLVTVTNIKKEQICP